MLHELGRTEVQTGFGWGKLNKKRHLGNLVMAGRIILKGILNNKLESMGKLIWLLTGPTVGLLCVG
jgi:hypothetical protein